MVSKKEKSIEFLKNCSFYICPICKSKIKVTDNVMSCSNNHNFDISKKGVVCLLNTGKLKTNYTYDKNLFTCRRNFILNGFYNEVYENIIKELKDNINILDLGCGEGTHDKLILDNIKTKYKFLGLDYNKDAIEKAIEYADKNTGFITSDVNCLPLNDSSFDVIINILSPYYTDEVLRVLKEDGLFIKVIPDKNYLIELRKELGFNKYEKVDILKNKLEKNFNIVKETTINKTYNIDKEQLNNLILMTPLIKSKKLKNNKKENISLNNITINLKVLIMRRK